MTRPKRQPRRTVARARPLSLAVGLALLLAALTACDTTPVVLHGTVTTASGTAPVGLEVRLYADDTSAVVASTTTAVDGSYTFRQSQVPDGTYRLRIGAQWWDGATGWADATSIALTAATATDIDVTVAEAGSLSGTVVDPDGAPVAGASVAALDNTWRAVATATTAADGTFHVGVPESGFYRMMLVAPDGSDGVFVGGPHYSTELQVTDGDVPIGIIDITTGRSGIDPGRVAVAAGLIHSCVLRDDGTVWCQGVAGTGSTILLPVPGLLDASAISAGLEHTCAVRSGGTIVCWGENEDGQLGDGTTTDSTTPVAVTGIDDATSVSAGQRNTCAVRDGGTVTCWGRNDYGQLGDGTTTDSTAPVAVTGIDDATAVSIYGTHACAVRAGGSVACWGSSALGQLGDGTRSDAPNPTPVPVSGLTDATSVAAGGWHTCARRIGGQVVCWGSNLTGELGNGTTSGGSPNPLPVPVGGLTDATAVVAQEFFSCALRAAGTVSCWGHNDSGQLGNDTGVDSSVPVPVDGVADAVALSAGHWSGVALGGNGALFYWGNLR